MKILHPLLFGFALLCITQQAYAFGNKPVSISNAVISDSLVKNLQCSNLSEDTLLANLQPDAFDSSKNIGIANDNPDAVGIGHCWALSHAQRILYYLGRFGQPSQIAASLTSSNIDDVSNMVSQRGKYGSVFTVTPDIANYFNGDTSKHDINKDIESYQLQHFFDPMNLGLLLGNGARSSDENESALEYFKSELAKNWLPIIVLRLSATLQHVVIVKKIHDPDTSGIIAMDIYDSNQPSGDVQMTYNTQNREFYAPEAEAEMFNATGPIGVFSVDDDAMKDIQKTLFNYYKNICEQTKSQ